MKQDWQNVSAGKCFANVLQEMDITLSNYNGFLVNERPFCSVEPLELGHAKGTWSSVLEHELEEGKLVFQW